MASSSKSTGPYAVFLSFRGTDVRNSFASHLYNELVRNGIHIFRDNEELRKGQDISMVLKAIEESCIAIIIFSEDYTSSWWCLEEVAKIMQCKEQKDLTVLPVFYKVDPKEVREGRASYAKGLAKHESKHGKDSKEMERWKEALRHAGRLSGWTLNDGDDESNVIQKIVKDISNCLNQTPLEVAEHPVGIESRVAEVKSMLNLESKDVLMVGLWGQGGIGKTTLGRAIYNDISRQFEGSSFLANVRERSKGCMDLVALQEQLLNDILLPPQRLVVSEVARGNTLIPLRLCQRRVLVILDDVNEEEQLCALVGKAKWFGSGSRILVTTRNRHFLTRKLDWDHVHVYEVKVLDDGGARELLRKHAFPTYQKLESRTDLVHGFLNHAKGLPLALVVLGSSLRDTTEAVWENKLEKLSKNLDRKINNVLRVSYDELDKDEQEIFLHIACFFKGRGRAYTKNILDSCDLQTATGFDTLIKRSLIYIERGGRLQLHDLIQSMGMEIVNRESDDPERRSRLWLCEDVFDVLSCDMGDCDVKAIVLEPPVPIKIPIGHDAFIKLRKLRLLILRNVSFQGPVCLPNRLRWFEWADAPWIPEFSSGPNKLVGLEMPGGRMTTVPKPLVEFQHLKYMNFSDCSSLVRMPDISCAPNLEDLNFARCINLVEAHDSVANHENRHLKYMNFSDCSSLVRMPDISCAPNLEDLDFARCINLVEAHESVANHENLRRLNFETCRELRNFPKELKSKKLRGLNLSGCTKFERFPNIPHELEALTSLSLLDTAVKELPASIENLVSLEYIYLGGCKNLVRLPSNIYKLQKLEGMGVAGCPNLIGFPKQENVADPCMKTGFSNLRLLWLGKSYQCQIDVLENLSRFPPSVKVHLSGGVYPAIPASPNEHDILSLLVAAKSKWHQLQEIPELPPTPRHAQHHDRSSSHSGC